MAEGLSLNRIGNISKSQTNFNISLDYKEFLKAILEEEIVQITRDLETRVVSSVPDSKSLINLDTPQLSLHRVKSIMQKETDLKVGTEAAIMVKSRCEQRIAQITRLAEMKARDERLSTIKQRHIPQNFGEKENGQEDGGTDDQRQDDPGEPLLQSGPVGGGFLLHDGIKTLARQYTQMKIDPEGLEEIGFWIEDSVEQEMLNIEKSFMSKDASAIIDSYNSISGIISQLTIKKVLINAEELARERNNRSITIEDISDAFNRTQLR